MKKLHLNIILKYILLKLKRDSFSVCCTQLLPCKRFEIIIRKTIYFRCLLVARWFPSIKHWQSVNNSKHANQFHVLSSAGMHLGRQLIGTWLGFLRTAINYSASCGMPMEVKGSARAKSTGRLEGWNIRSRPHRTWYCLFCRGYIAYCHVLSVTA